MCRSQAGGPLLHHMELVLDNEGVASLPDLAERIASEIQRLGPISFARFMELALYDPSSGYYRRDPHPFGRDGDFYTAEQLQPVFGELMESFVAQLAKDAHSEFSVCEVGSGRGEMSQTLAHWNYRGYEFGRGELPSRMQGLVLANEF